MTTVLKVPPVYPCCLFGRHLKMEKDQEKFIESKCLYRTNKKKSHNELNIKIRGIWLFTHTISFKFM